MGGGRGSTGGALSRSAGEEVGTGGGAEEVISFGWEGQMRAEARDSVAALSITSGHSEDDFLFVVMHRAASVCLQPELVLARDET